MCVPIKVAEQDQYNDQQIVKGVLLVVTMLTVAATATLSPAAPAMRQAFEDVENVNLWVRLVVTLPALFIALTAPLAGTIIDHSGHKPLLIASVILYALAGASGYLTSSLIMILLGRAVLGIAVGGMMTSVTALIANYYSGAARAQFLGLQSAFMGLGGTAFVVIGGILADVEWRAPFLIYLTGLLILPFILGILREPVGQGEVPTALEIVHPYPNRVIVRLLFTVYGTVFLIQVTYFAIAVQLPFFLGELTSGAATQSGLAIAWLSLNYAFASAMAKRVNEHFNYGLTVMLGFLLIGIGLVVIGAAQGWSLLLIGLPIVGIGIGLIQPTMNVWLTSETPVKLRSRVIGGFTTAIFLGQFVSPFISQPISQAVGLSLTFTLFGITALLVSGLVLLLRSRLFADVQT